MQTILPISVPIQGAARQSYGDYDGVVRCEQTFKYTT